MCIRRFRSYQNNISFFNQYNLFCKKKNNKIIKWIKLITIILATNNNKYEEEEEEEEKKNLYYIIR